jgi:hypothetical protein
MKQAKWFEIHDDEGNVDYRFRPELVSSMDCTSSESWEVRVDGETFVLEGDDLARYKALEGF